MLLRPSCALTNGGPAVNRNDGDHTTRPKLLNGFFWCPTHDRALEVSGAHGHAMVCKDCRGTDAARDPYSPTWTGSWPCTSCVPRSPT